MNSFRLAVAIALVSVTAIAAGEVSAMSSDPFKRRSEEYSKLFREHQANSTPARDSREEQRRKKDAALKTIASAKVNNRVDNVCFVSGLYPYKQYCKALSTLPSTAPQLIGRRGSRLGDDLKALDERFSRQMVDDLFDSLTLGRELVDMSQRGDLAVCGGLSDLPTSVVAVPHPPLSGAAGAIVGAQARVNACQSARNDQISRRGGGSGGRGTMPGPERNTEATAYANKMIDGFVAACEKRHGKNSLIQANSDSTSTSSDQMSAGEAIYAVADTTLDIFTGGAEILAACTGGVGCAAAAIAGAAELGLNVASLEASGTAGAAVQGAQAGFAMLALGTVLVIESPVIAVAVGVSALVTLAKTGEAIGNAVRNTISPDPQPQGSPPNQSRSPNQQSAPPQGRGGTPTPSPRMPSENVPVNCEMLATGARARAQMCEASNWRAYDCQVWMFQWRSCADPALVLPAPGEEWSCVTKPKKGDLCRLEQKQKSLIAIPSDPYGGRSVCDARDQLRQLDVFKMVRSDFCLSATPGPDSTGGNLCQSAAPRSR